LLRGLSLGAVEELGEAMIAFARGEFAQRGRRFRNEICRRSAARRAFADPRVCREGIERLRLDPPGFGSRQADEANIARAGAQYNLKYMLERHGRPTLRRSRRSSAAAASRPARGRA